MAERSRFFNSTENDIREYTASEFAEYFSKFLSNGVYVEDGEAGLKVSPGSGLSVNIAPGYAYLEGYLYENDTELTKEIEPADNVLNRIDRVVIRLDVTNRQILTHIKKGTFSSSPTPPALVNTGNIVELSLAQVKVNANASTVQVVDERFTEHCGLVELLAEVPLNELMEQWNTWFADRQKEVSKYATTSGTGGNYIANINGITELLEGLKITVKFHEGRTGESFINLNGFGNTPIKKPGGGNPNIKTNGVYSLVFDGLNFQLQGEGGEYGTATQNEVLEGYTIGTEQGLIEGILKLTGTALSNQVLSGRTFYNTNAKTKITGTMPNRGAVSHTITTQGGSYTIPAGYHNGSGKVTANFANLVASNIKSGVNIGGVVGTMNPSQFATGTTTYISTNGPSSATISLSFTPKLFVAYGNSRAWVGETVDTRPMCIYYEDELVARFPVLLRIDYSECRNYVHLRWNPSTKTISLSESVYNSDFYGSSITWYAFA